MAHPHGDGSSIYLARISIPCKDHDEHVVFFGSLDNLAHVLASDMAAHYAAADLTLNVQTFTLPRELAGEMVVAVTEDADDIPF
jgi:hypothetical protein